MHYGYIGKSAYRIEISFQDMYLVHTAHLLCHAFQDMYPVTSLSRNPRHLPSAYISVSSMCILGYDTGFNFPQASLISNSSCTASSKTLVVVVVVVVVVAVVVVVVVVVVVIVVVVVQSNLPTTVK